MDSNLSVKPLKGNFGVEYQGIDVGRISDEDLKNLLRNLYKHRLVVLRTRGLTKEEFVAFSKRVGDPILHVLKHTRMKGYPEILTVSNIEKDTEKQRLGAAHWHTDQSYDEDPSSVTLLYSVQAPNVGGQTLFCDMMGAYETLPEADRERMDDLKVEHLYGSGFATRPGDHTPSPLKGQNQLDAVPTVYHPLIRRHPVTGNKTLYSVAGTSRGIRGMSRADSEKLLRTLGDHAFQDRFITQHTHSVHDLVMWDNPSTMHAATPLPAATGPHDTRMIYRISVRGIPSVFSTGVSK